MAQPLMPKATAVWLVDNTVLTFDQIADFCGLHPLEVEAIADDEVGSGIIGANPIQDCELTKEEIERCEKDTGARLIMATSNLPQPKVRSKGPKYTPISKRGDKPDAISYLLKNHTELSESQISRLIGTTKLTIEKVRERTHPNSTNIKPQNPVELGLCSKEELEKAVTRAQNKLAKEAAKKEKAAPKQKTVEASEVVEEEASPVEEIASQA